ncbi:uncharacterized protein BYT42DRAFT_495486, partial [Radiomyces spectabilis]|uniref:uncharacterized protein n=1 Tax=Radiomyces spectabilis TaxID=64574 RepID=UPI00221F893E
EPRLSLSVLNSDVPTTLVDMQRLTVKHTPLFPAYQQLQKRYHAWLDAKFEDELAAYVSEQPRSSSSDTHPHWRRHSIFHRSDSIAPMVQNLLDDLRKIPARMREAYIRQWRRWLIRYAVALIKYVDEEMYVHGLQKITDLSSFWFLDRRVSFMLQPSMISFAPSCKP